MLSPQYTTVLVEFAFACACLIFLIVSLALALRSHWTYKNTPDRLRKATLLTAIIAYTCYVVLDIIQLATQEDHATVRFSYFIVYIFSSVAYRLGEIALAVFIPRTILQQLHLSNASPSTQRAVRWVAILLFGLITCLQITGTALYSALYGQQIRSHVLEPFELAINPLSDDVNKVDFTLDILWLSYIIFLFTVLLTKARKATNSKKTNSLIIILLALLFIDQLMSAVQTGTSLFKHPLNSAADLSHAGYFIELIAPTAIVTIAPILGLSRSRHSTDTAVGRSNDSQSRKIDDPDAQSQTCELADAPTIVPGPAYGFAK
ncbi:MAG: hypothetical protein M1828_005760 [Chrysothrix sp. TS-e1954]|nr:MAG: hypothetical protein M1828_005760 [Chrysothrix sp. TS-e1954]